jgi:hypothetical protein
LIADLAAAGVAAVSGTGVDAAAWAAAKHRPRLVFVRGEPVPDGVTPTALRRCQNHRDRNEAMSARGPTLSGSTKLCSECRDERVAAFNLRRTSPGSEASHPSTSPTQSGAPGTSGPPVFRPPEMVAFTSTTGH